MGHRARRESREERSRRSAIWIHEDDLVRRMLSRRDNPVYLPGIEIPDTVTPTSDLGRRDARRAAIVVFAVPTPFARALYDRLAPHLAARVPVVVATKGIEEDTLLLPLEVATSRLGAAVPVAAMSGPSFAAEVARGVPTAVVIAAEDAGLARTLQDRLSGETPSPLHERRRRRRADRRGVEERRRDRGGDRGRAGFREQHGRRDRHARPGRDPEAGRRARSVRRDVFGTRVVGRSGADLHGRPLPQPPGRPSARARRASGRSPREDVATSRRACARRAPPATWRPSRGWRCPSSKRSTGSSTKTAFRAMRSDGS